MLNISKINYLSQERFDTKDPVGYELDFVKSTVAHEAMPSDTFENWNLETSGSSNTYEAPSDGYIFVSMVATTAGQYFKAYIGNPLIYTKLDKARDNDEELSMLFPIKKGDTFYFEYTADGTLNYFRFIYAVGSEIDS